MKKCENPYANRISLSFPLYKLAKSANHPFATSRPQQLYDDICDTEDRIIACEQKKQAVEQNVLTVENVYKMLSVFEDLYDKMDAEDRREVIRSLIAELELYPKATWKKGKSPIKSIKYTFPVSCEVVESFCENESCVCWAV